MPARRVLVVEDDAAIRRGVVDALRFQGYVPLEAATFKDALASATRDSFELLLLDLVLDGNRNPVPTGLEEFVAEYGIVAANERVLSLLTDINKGKPLLITAMANPRANSIPRPLEAPVTSAT